MSNRNKHLDKKYYFVKDYDKKKIIESFYLQYEEMLADSLTKPLTLSELENLRVLASHVHLRWSVGIDTCI